jgi:molecular chaperone Hsp33
VVLAHHAAIQPDGIEVFVLEDAGVRGSIVHGTRMVNQMRENHDLGVLECLILGHGYLAASLLSATMKGRDRLSIDITSEGPARGLSVEAWASGRVRGYLKRNPVPLLEPPQSLEMTPFIGPGTLTLTRFLHGARRPYAGTVPLVHSSVARDLARYYLYSEQSPTAFALSVYFDSQGRSLGAGGVFLQAFPGGQRDALAVLERDVRGMGSIGTYFAEGGMASELVEDSFSEFSPRLIGRRSVAFGCGCSKQRLGRLLAALPEEELRDLQATGPFPLRTTCHNCSTSYDFTRGEIQNLSPGRSSTAQGECV